MTDIKQLAGLLREAADELEARSADLAKDESVEPVATIVRHEYTDGSEPENGFSNADWARIESLETGTTLYTTPPAPAVSVPDGYALVPQPMHFDREAAKALIFLTGNPDDEDEFSECVLWVGNAKDEDGEEKTYGLQANLVEYPEEGCVTIIEFAAAPQPEES